MLFPFGSLSFTQPTTKEVDTAFKSLVLYTLGLLMPLLQWVPLRSSEVQSVHTLMLLALFSYIPPVCVFYSHVWPLLILVATTFPLPFGSCAQRWLVGFLAPHAVGPGLWAYHMAWPESSVGCYRFCSSWWLTF